MSEQALWFSFEQVLRNKWFGLSYGARSGSWGFSSVMVLADHVQASTLKSNVILTKKFND